LADEIWETEDLERSRDGKKERVSRDDCGRALLLLTDIVFW